MKLKSVQDFGSPWKVVVAMLSAAGIHEGR